MSVHTLKTAILISIGGAEVEYNAAVKYTRIPSFDGGTVCPSEPSYCQVVGITIEVSASVRHELDFDIVEALQDELQPALMEDWTDDLAAAAEYRAEARREDRMMEQF